MLAALAPVCVHPDCLLPSLLALLLLLLTHSLTSLLPLFALTSLRYLSLSLPLSLCLLPVPAGPAVPSRRGNNKPRGVTSRNYSLHSFNSLR